MVVSLQARNAIYLVHQVQVATGDLYTASGLRLTFFISPIPLTTLNGSLWLSSIALLWPAILQYENATESETGLLSFIN
jgi:hypothetical protein